MNQTATSLRRLFVSDFRCFLQAEISSDGRPAVLTGPNAAGKTNLLEAISLLAPGRGLRGARSAEIARRLPGEAANDSSWAVAAEFETRDGPRQIGTGRAIGPSGAERRLIKIDGAPARGQQALAEIVSVVWLTPRMDGLFREGASGRRRFLDRLVYGYDPEHASRVNAYEHALRERARLLKSGQRDDAWLSGLEESMASRGMAIAAARRDMVGRLTRAASAGVGPFPSVGLALDCLVRTWLDEMPALAAEDHFRAQLAQSRRRDADSGGATVGPHRSDLLVRHLENDQPADLCSTGEQKALLIAILLAHSRLLTLERGAAPLLLLDEVAAHLDPLRRGALYREILALGSQAWMTGTDASAFADLGDAAQFFEVRDAAVTASPPL